MSGDMAATSVHHHCGRQWAAQSESGRKKEKGSNHLEV